MANAGKPSTRRPFIGIMEAMNHAGQSPFESYSIDQLRTRRSIKWRAFDPDVLPLWIAEMDAALAPAVTEALATAVRNGDTGYPNSIDLAPAFSDFAADHFGWRVPRDKPVLVPDVMAGIRVALDEVSRPGDKVIVSTPVYPPFFDNISVLERQLVSCPLARTDDGYRFDFDRLESVFADGAAVYLMCNPHNPVGRVYTRAELETIADLAQRYDVRVISDEVHAPLTMPRYTHIPFATLDHEAAARSFTCVAASKAWNLAGMKAALLIPGPELGDIEVPEYVTMGTGLFGVLAGTAAFTHGREWLAHAIAGIDERRVYLQELLNVHAPNVGYVPPQATYLAWLDFSAYDLPTPAAQYLLEHARVAVNDGATFVQGGQNFVRLNLATSRDVLSEAVTRIGTALSQ